MTRFLKSSWQLWILAAFLGSAPAHAIVSFGVRGGVTLSNQNAHVDTATYESSMGYMAGVGARINAGLVGVLVDALYTLRTVNVDNTPYTFTSIHIPAQLNFGVGPLLLTGGMYYAMGVNDIDVDGSILTYADAHYKSTDYGLVVGVGIKLLSLSIEGRYNYGLANVSTLASETKKNRSIDLVAGIWF